MSALAVIRPGPLALLQDSGRPGLAGIGVTRSGAADRGAFLAGAALVGNDAAGSQAAVEILLGGLVFEVVEGPVRLAITGAPCPVRVGEITLPYGRAVEVGAGMRVGVGMAPRGLRCYLSVAGGLAVEAEFGSRSRDTLAGLGPEPLQAGILLPVGTPYAGSPSASPITAAVAAPEWTQPTVLAIQPGPRTDWLADPVALAGDWQVSASSDRVGVRLLGGPLAWAPARRGTELPSEPVVRGAIQVPPNGLPVVFGPDHPTTGGYPVVAVLTESASDRLAQVRPGEAVTLRWRR
ncbi:MAG: biotin-dependent carboxyltransferase family protein [Propionicimonas sp.]